MSAFTRRQFLIGSAAALGAACASSVAASAATTHLPTGFPSLDAHLGGGLKRGGVTLLCSRPWIGKTSWASNVVLHAAQQQGARVLVVSAIDSREQFLYRLAASASGVDLRKRDAREIECVRGLVRVHGTAFLPEVYISDPLNPTVGSIVELIAKDEHQQPFDLVVLDSVQCLPMVADTWAQHAAGVFGDLAEVATRSGATVLLLSAMVGGADALTAVSWADLRLPAVVGSTLSETLVLRPLGQGGQAKTRWVGLSRMEEKPRPRCDEEIVFAFHAAQQRFVEVGRRRWEDYAA